jgi:hypothetical protein
VILKTFSNFNTSSIFLADEEEHWSLTLYTYIDSPGSLTTDVYVLMKGHLGRTGSIILKNTEPLKSGSVRKFNFNLQNNNLGKLESIEISIPPPEHESYNWHLYKVK